MSPFTDLFKNHLGIIIVIDLIAILLYFYLRNKDNARRRKQNKKSKRQNFEKLIADPKMRKVIKDGVNTGVFKITDEESRKHLD